MLCHAGEQHAADCGTKDTECRKGNIVAKQSDCIVSSRKANITMGVFDTRLGGAFSTPALARVASAPPKLLAKCCLPGSNMRIVNGENHILGLAASRSHRHTRP